MFGVCYKHICYKYITRSLKVHNGALANSRYIACQNTLEISASAVLRVSAHAAVPDHDSHYDATLSNICLISQQQAHVSVVVFNGDELEHGNFAAQNITMDTARTRL